MGDAAFWLTTNRLGLRRFTEHDLDWLTALYRNRNVTRHLGGPRDPDKAGEILGTRILDYYEHHPGLGIWMTVERETNAGIGFHLLNHIQGESFIQVGYVLDEPFWGRGYATEMAATVVRYGFRDLGLPRIHAIATLDNGASHRVLLKIGLKRNGERAFAHPAYSSAGPMAWFERDRDDWMAERDRDQDQDPT
jgi:ribosomal-protein-alanine N-acetyltransferase